MKTGKIKSKLALNKKTIYNLDEFDMGRIQGMISGAVCPPTSVCATRICTDLEATCTDDYNCTGFTCHPCP